MFERMKNLLSQLMSAIKDNKKLIPNFVEPFIDSLPQDELLKKFPLVSTVMTTFELRDSYYLKRFKKNLVAFLETCEKIDKDQVAQKLEEIKNDPVFAENFLDVSFSILIESTKPMKAKILAYLIDALAKKEITKEEFDEMAQIVQAAMPPAIISLKSFLEKNPKGSVQAMHNEFEPYIFSLGCGFRSGTQFGVSNIGKKLFENALKKLET